MNSILDSFACLTVFSLSIYIVLRIFSKSFTAVFKNEHSVKSIRNENEYGRDLGPYESYLADLTTRYGSKIYAVLSLKAAVSLRRENVKKTLILLARKHVILRAVLSKHSGLVKRFIVTPEETFVPELRFVNTSNWKIILEEELLVNIERSELLWKTVVLREQYYGRDKVYISTLLFLFDPVIVDRISVVKFTEDFVAMLCQVSKGDVECTRIFHLHQPSEEFLKPSFLAQLVSIFRRLLVKLSFVSESRQHKQRQAWVKPLIIVKCLSENDTCRLLQYCRHLNCSLSTLFIAAWSEIMSSQTGSTRALCRRKSVTVIADYRMAMSIGLPHLTNSSSSFQIQPLNEVDNKSRGFLSRSQHCESLLNSAQKKKRYLDLVWQLRYQKSISQERFIKLSPFEIADIGRVDFQSTWPFSLHEILIGASSTSTVNLTLLVVNNKLQCVMHLASHFSGCADLLNSMFLRIIQNMSFKM